MRTPSLALAVLLTAGCGSQHLDGPLPQQAPPGSQGLTLDGPSRVVKGTTQTWTVTASDLMPGESIQIGWGGRLGAGTCPYPQLVGSPLCFDVTGPARPLGSEIAGPHPTIPGQGIASFTFDVPRMTTRTEVYLQAFKLDGSLSATSNPLLVEIADPCDPLGLPFGGGDGSEQDPYQICANAHLNSIRGVSNLHALQMADLDLAGSGLDAVSVGPGCHYDGNGYVLDGYDGVRGLFGNDCAFRNITMTNIAMNVPAGGSGSYGPLISEAFEGFSVFDNISTQGTVTVQGTGSFAGGVVGRNFAEAHNIRADVTVIGGTAGGIFGAFGSESASELHATGDVTSTDGPAGGVIGSLLGRRAEVRNSSAQGNVTGATDAGGFVGSAILGSVVEDSIATGMVSGTTSAGGFIGDHIDGTLERCAAKGDVSGSERVGGFAGTSQASIVDAYSTGSVDITTTAATCTPAQDVGGGFIGRASGTISRILAAPLDVNVDALEGFDIVGTNCDGSLPTDLSDVYVLPHPGAPAELVASTDVSAAPEAEATYPALDFGTTWVIPTLNPTNPQGLRLPVLQHECGEFGIVCP